MYRVKLGGQCSTALLLCLVASCFERRSIDEHDEAGPGVSGIAGLGRGGTGNIAAGEGRSGEGGRRVNATAGDAGDDANLASNGGSASTEGGEGGHTLGNGGSEGSAERLCGGTESVTCLMHEYCAYTPGQDCGRSGIESVCQIRPAGCLGNVAPVCGCDGITHSNACQAARSGNGVMHEGACE